MGEKKRKQRPTNAIVMALPRFNKRMAIISIFVILILIGGTAFYLAARSAKPQLSQQGLSNKVSNYVSAGKYKDAINLIDSQPAKMRQTFDAQMLLASVYTSEKNYSAASTVYDSYAKQHGLTQSAASNAAVAAQNAHNYQQAIYYYQQAKTLATKSKSPLSQSNIIFYNSQIQQLQKQSK